MDIGESLKTNKSWAECFLPNTVRLGQRQNGERPQVEILRGDVGVHNRASKSDANVSAIAPERTDTVSPDSPEFRVINSASAKFDAVLAARSIAKRLKTCSDSY